MTGKVIDGREAHRIGFANRIAPADQLDEVTDAFANEFLACAPKAVGLAKRVIDAAAKPALAATLEQEVQAQQQLAATDDFKEGARGVLREAPAGLRGPMKLDIELPPPPPRRRQLPARKAPQGPRLPLRPRADRGRRADHRQGRRRPDARGGRPRRARDRAQPARDAEGRVRRARERRRRCSSCSGW